MKTLCLLSALTAVALIGCEDDSVVSRTDLPDWSAPDSTLIQPDAEADMAAPDLGLADAAIDAEIVPDASPPPPVVSWVEITVNPRRLLYRPGDAVQATAQAFDRVGDALDGLPVTWRVLPMEAGAVDADGVITLEADGALTLQGCVPSGPSASPVCGQAAMYVDSGDPSLVVEQPARGAMLGGDLTETISVRGVASDTGGALTVRVNGLPVALDDEGRFGIDLPAELGMNRVIVTADDGVRQPPVTEIRDVLWAPRYLSVDEGATLEDALWLNLTQGVLSGGAPPEAPDASGRIYTEDLTTLIQRVVSLVDPEGLLGGVALGGLEIVRADIGPVELSLAWSDEGLEIFLRLARLELQISGSFAVQGEPIPLDGTLTASLAGFASAAITLSPEGGLSVEVVDSSVALEALNGDLEDPQAQAIFSTFGSQLRGTVEGAVDGVLRGVLIDQLPSLITGAILGLTEALGDLPLNLDTGVEGVPPVRMRLALTPSAVEARRMGALAMTFQGQISHPDGAPAPRGLGVPAGPAPVGPPEATRASLGLALRLELVNAILYEVWRGGLLTQVPALPDAAAGLVDAVALDGLLPPVVVPASPWGAAALEAQIGGLLIEVVRPGAEAPDLYAVSLRSGLDLQPGEAGLILALDAEPEVVAHYLGGPNPAAAYPEALVANLVGGSVWPAVGEALAGGLALPVGVSEIAVTDLQALAPDLTSLGVGPVFPAGARVVDGWVILEGDLVGALQIAP